MCAGYDNGDVKLFDLRNMSLRWETNIKNGVRSSAVSHHSLNNIHASKRSPTFITVNDLNSSSSSSRVVPKHRVLMFSDNSAFLIRT